MALPVVMITLSLLHLINLKIAINISIVSALLLLIGWSVGSAKSLQASNVPIVLLVIAELAIGLAIVGLKLVIGH